MICRAAVGVFGSDPTPPPVAEAPMPPPAPDIRRLLLQLVLRVLAVHAVAIALYYAADVARAGQHIRLAFVTVWMALTLAVVLPSLLRIRRARRPPRRPPRSR
jgi:hypothetical protein